MVKIWGVDSSELSEIGRSLGISIDNGRDVGKAFAFRLVPEGTQYQRRGQQEYKKKDGSTYHKRIKALCYHGFKDFIITAFNKGASRVQSSWGNWETIEEFTQDLPELKHKNIGSIMYPVEMIELCDCEN